MYTPQEIANNIKEQTKNKNQTMKTLLENCELNKNTINKLAGGSDVGYQTIVKIADYLDCSVDLLLGREQNNNAPNDVRSAIIELVNAVPDDRLDRLLGYLEALAAE